MATNAIPPLQVLQLPLASLVEPATNPNVMDAGDFARLVEAIRDAGFFQPLLVRPAVRPQGRVHTDSWEIVDGAHRARAAGVAGLTEVTCVVAPLDDRRAKLLQLGMNRLRGALDLSQVAREVNALHLAAPDLDDLTLSGFSDDDVLAMCRIASGQDPDPVDDGLASGPEPDDDNAAPPKPFMLELRFDTGVELSRVKRYLRKSSGKGVPLSVGLLRLIDGA